MEKADYQQKINAEAEYWDDFYQEIIDKVGYGFLSNLDKQKNEMSVLPKYISQHDVFLIFFPQTEYILSLRGNNKKALDVGCGSGWLSLHLARCGLQTTGLDISPKAIAIANKLKSKEPQGVRNRLKYQIVDLNSVKLSQRSYDYIISWNILHHIPKVDSLLGQIKDSLKPKGEFIIFEYLGHSKKNLRISGWVKKILPKKYVNKISQEIKNKKSIASPFDGVTSWELIDKIKENFVIKKYDRMIAFADNFVEIINPPKFIEKFTYYLIVKIDKFLTWIKLLDGTTVFLVLTKK